MSDASEPDLTSFKDELGFDPDALKARYLAERDKRLRREGNDQYLEVAGTLAHYRDDPYVEPGFTRDPIVTETEIAIIGGGFGGLTTGARLRQAGIADLRIIDKAGDFGGTWYWNRYPGISCDIESYIYLPLLEEVGYIPADKYSRGSEIRDYVRRLGEHFDLYKDAIFQTEVTELRWDDESSRWIVRTNRGDEIKAQFVVMANGPADKPRLPGIPGIETFKGHSFHTSRWDYGYTGGDSSGGLTGLVDKRVGVIGTGATGIQCIPHVGQWARELFVFQRTPSTVDERNNRPTDPEWVKSLTPGWQQRRMDNFNTLVCGGLADEDLVNDGWTDIIGNILMLASKKKALGEPVEDAAALTQIADYKKMEQLRARIDREVKDPVTAEALKPYYNLFCKRPCFHDEYLATFNRPNVHLVDTQGRGVERITEKGAVVAGVEYELDCLIFATGFEFGTAYTRRSGYEVYGRGGQTLSQKWADGVATLHGMHSRGFPNCFIIALTQSGHSANFTHMISEQARHIAYVVARAKERGARIVEASAEGEAAWVQTIISLADIQRKFLEECTPSRFNNEGKVEEMDARNGPYGAGPAAFIKVLEEWRADGKMEGLELS